MVEREGEGRRKYCTAKQEVWIDGWMDGGREGGGRRSDRGLYERGIAEVGLEDAVLYCNLHFDVSHGHGVEA